MFQKPLHQHSSPRTPGSSLPETVKTGFCDDKAPVAAVVTNSFLDFSASHGLDLRSKGIGPGQRYCLEATRWRDACENGVEEVPRVKLECTHAKALDTVGLDRLRQYSAEQDNFSGVVWPGQRGSMRESGEIGGKEPKA